MTELASSARAGSILKDLDLKLKKDIKIILLTLGVYEAFFFDYVKQT